MDFLVFNLKLLAIVSSHLGAAQNSPRHMYKETFLPIGVAIVTLQQKFSDYKVRIAMSCCYFSSFIASQLALRVPPAETRLTVVRSTLLQGACFRNQGVLQQVGGIPPFTKFHIVKLYPNEEFSTSIIMIFDVDSNCVHLRF